MARTAGSLPISIARCAGIAVAAVLALALWAPTAAHASGCQDSWTNAAGGSWYEGANWSTKAPPKEGEEACITVAGTYTVTMDQTIEGVAVESLTLGGSSGTQTLLVAATCGANAKLTTTEGLAIQANGALTTTKLGCNNNVRLVGPISNAGTLTSEGGEGGDHRFIDGDLTNTGTFDVDSTTEYNAKGTTLTNEGTIDLATGVALVGANEAAIVNASGAIDATGTGTVGMEPGTTFKQGNGTTSGAKPVILRQANLIYTGTGASKITQHGEGNTLSGNLAEGQSLVLESTNGEHEKTTASASFTSAGSITLTKSESNNNNARLVISSGTLSNTGTITSEAAEGGSHRFLEGNITNTGTIDIDSDTEFNAAKATLTNEGTLNVANEVRLAVSDEGSVANGGGGKIVATGSGDVAIEPETSFTEGAGTTSGAKPVILRNAALHYTGGGESKITQHGEGNTLSGNLAAGQSLVLESTNGEHEKTTASESFSSAGAITLTKSESNNNNAGLVISSGTLTNSGTITSQAAEGANHRYIQGNLTNTGTLQIDSETNFNGSAAALVNEGALNLAEGTQLNVSNDSTVTNGTGGKIVAGEGANVFVEPGGGFTEGAGTTNGAKPVILRDAALTYTGVGESKITQHGEGNTLSGNLAAGQSLVLESTNGEHEKTTASESFSSAGSITLTKSESNNNNARLVIGSGTLTNSGTITSEAAEGANHRFIEGSVTNKGTLQIDSETNFNGSTAALINEGALDLAEGTQLNVSGDGTVTNGAGGKIAAGLTGNVFLEPGSAFTEGAGVTTGTLPVIVRDGGLAYTGAGASTIAQRGEGGTLSGNLAAGQSLVLESTNGEHEKTTASASFTNEGTITLTKSETNNNNATLDLGGQTLTNDGTVAAELGNGAQRQLDGNLTNNRLVLVGANTNLKVTGTYTQAESGTLETQIGGTSNFGSLSASGAASIAGNVYVRQVDSFKGEKGQVFGILAGASRTGKFAHTYGATIAPELYYAAVNTAAGANLDVLEGEPPEKVPANETKPTISGGTQQGQTIVLDSPGAWSQSPGEFSYQWLRCEESGANCQLIPGATGRNYLLTGADAHHRITVQVTAYDTAGESLPAEPSSPSPVISALALHAYAGEPISAVEGASVTLDGSGSTPAAEIAKYRWQFGDGTATEEGAGDAILHHVYASAGKYTATLTVFRGAEESSATIAVTVTAKPKPAGGGHPAEGVYVSVKGEGAEPIDGATVLYVGSGGARIEAASGSDGEAVLKGLPEGTDTVYLYKSGLRPATEQVTVNGEGDGTASVTLSKGEVAAAEVKSKELNYEEIVAAGINPSEPANQNVYKFVIKLAFIESPPVVVQGYVNGGGEFVGSTGASGGGGGWSCGSGGCEGGGGGGGGGGGERIIAQPEVVEGHPLIQWLILHGKAAVLKQFFEVSMIVQNLSPEPFELAKGTATLNLPEGLSLAPTAAQQSLTNEVPAVPGGGSVTTNWIIRGDTPGEYNLSANYKSTLEPFDAPVSVQAALANPLKVWGKEAMTLKVKADSGKLHEGVPYHVYVGVENKSDVPLYNVNLTIEENPHVSFVFQPEQQFSEQIGELKPGETFFVKRPYILIPNAESVSVFNPALSSATFVGEKEHPGANIEAIPAPTMYPLESAASIPGYVRLKWTHVPGAEGYKVFSTKTLETLFTNTPLSVLESSTSKTGVTELPAGATEAYVPASSTEKLWYAVSTVVGGHLELESSPMVEASAPVKKLAATKVVLTSYANPASHGSGGNLRATVSVVGGGTPTGTVTFKEGSKVLGTEALSGDLARYPLNMLSFGEHAITATYNGDENDEPGESSSFTETVTVSSTQVVLTSYANPASHGSAGNLRATVTAVAPGGDIPMGTVTFKEGSKVLGTEALSGDLARYPLDALSSGEHTITATYNGDENDEPSESSSFTQTITVATTLVLTDSGANPASHGSAGNLRATVTAVAPGGDIPMGTVTFKEGSKVLGTEALSGDLARYPLDALSSGEHTITATYNGDENDEPSESSSFTQTITKASSHVVLTSGANPASHGSGYNLLATVTAVAPGGGTPTGTVTFKEGATLLGTEALSGHVARYPLKAFSSGEHTITATYNGDENDEPGESSSFTQTVDP